MSRARPSQKARRTAARLGAVQTLYGLEVAGGGVDAAIGEFLAHHSGLDVDGETLVPADPETVSRIVHGVQAQSASLDAMISEALVGQWSLERLEPLLRAILRAGAWEAGATLSMPAPILIAEYVNLAGAFFGGREPGMVNAVMEKLIKRLRKDLPAVP